MTDEPDATAGEAFWRFSLTLYARPGVAEALLALQDRARRDVNLVLYALWLGGARGRRLDAAGLEAAEAAILALNAGAVAPLRALRRELKAALDPGLAPRRRRIAGLELAGERRVQQRLANCRSDATPLPDAGDRLAAARQNLALVLGDEMRLPEAGVLLAALTALVRAGR